VGSVENTELRHEVSYSPLAPVLPHHLLRALAVTAQWQAASSRVRKIALLYGRWQEVRSVECVIRGETWSALHLRGHKIKAAYGPAFRVDHVRERPWDMWPLIASCGRHRNSPRARGEQSAAARTMGVSRLTPPIAGLHEHIRHA
jgi:hypothetical protein